MLLSLWYSKLYAERIIKISKMNKGGYQKQKKTLILYGWESREQKIEEYENGNNYWLW